MDKSDFVHLHVHSDHSLLDGLAKVPALVEKAARSGQKAIALTDHGTVSGVIGFWKECKQQGLKAILGCEIYQSLGRMGEKQKGYHHLTVLAKDDVGWRNLSKITSLANLEGYYYRPRVDMETLLAHKEGLVVLSGCLKGPIPARLQQGEWDEARRLAGVYKEAWGDDFYLEVQPNSLEGQKVVNEGCARLAREVGIKQVATCDLHYLEPADALAQEVRICISSGKTLQDENRLKMKDDFFFRDSEQMIAAFRDTPEAILATREIADKVTGYDLLPGKKNRYFLPVFKTPDGSSPQEWFEKTCREGLLRRYGPQPGKEVLERLEYEQGVIQKLGFVNYFLIVADFIGWARKHECAVGPGRGSAAGSVVAYCLGITDIDPLRYDLLFERFLNPERVSMPDIDVDFCETNRPRVIEYVRDTYGRDTVCQIVTFGTLKPKAAVKDVGRVLGLPYAEVDRISKLIPEGPKLKNLEQAFAEAPELAALRHDPRYEQLFDLALRVEGINRHAGKHAAGVVIADKDLIERIPLTRVKDDKTTQFTMSEVEEVGLLKMDFLGLRTLTLIEDTLKLIARARGRDAVPDMDRLPLDDPKTYELLARGDTAGVFQLESSGFRKLLKEARPDRFEDIVALIALYRPGPLGSGMDQQYINRKHGREPITYLTPLLEPILGTSYGCILYQEQVMLIANRIAGFSMAEADALRKAMGKKLVELMDKYKAPFLAGFAAKGVSEEIAQEVWSQIAFFAEYGFNRSHSAAYGLVTYRTAYLKAHFPVEFMAATLTSWMGDTDRLLEFKAECDRMKIEVVAPDVNRSDVTFSVEDGKVIYGLAAIRGIGDGAAQEIVKVRERLPGRRFRSLFHLTSEVEARHLAKATLETLVRAGAFDAMGLPRRPLFEVVEQAMQMGLQEQKDRLCRQQSLFGGGGGGGKGGDLEQVERELLPKLPEWKDAELLAHEKQALGFYLTRHPLDRHKELLERYTRTPLLEVQNLPEGAEVTVGGMVASLRTILDKKNNTMAFVVLEDFTGSCEAVVFGSTYPEIKAHLREENAVFVQGKVSRRREPASIQVEKMFGLEQAEGALGVKVEAELVLEDTTQDTVRRFREVLLAHQGSDPVYFSFRRKSDQALAGPFRVSSSFRVRGSEALREQLIGVLGPSASVCLRPR